MFTEHETGTKLVVTTDYFRSLFFFTRDAALQNLNSGTYAQQFFEVKNYRTFILSQSVLYSELVLIFSGNQLCQYWIKNQMFQRCPSPSTESKWEWLHATDVYTNLSSCYLFLLVYYAAGGQNQTVWSPIKIQHIAM